MLSYRERADARRRKLDAAVAELVDLCRGLADVRAMYVFGSYGRGTVGPDSDLDVLVVRDTHLPRLARGDDILLARRSLAPVDLIVLRPEEFAMLAERSGFGATVLKEARKLYAA